MNYRVPVWLKYSLNVEEASAYFGIGCKTLHQFIAEHDESFVLMIGLHVRIKRRLFEEYLDLNVSIL
ncbi:excisionase [Holdemanella sp.]|uniref:excisionase n=1 Tax=Holdemanella sp. TaxID=1971762 RepID=UPI002E76E9F0|nr:excisionase [Holdemanella sp.]MEE0467037.1 excisionase [Holdemanella sp.]